MSTFVGCNHKIMKDILPRITYLQDLVAYIDKPQVKILTGIRRSGKSSVLMIPPVSLPLFFR